jgi:hypothetical protein
MKTVYQYAIVRFLPFPETEEFANIGVAVCFPMQNLFIYRIDSIRRTKRISDFFDLHDRKELYTATLKAVSADLENFREAVCSDKLKANYVLELMQKPRETVVRYSGIRVGVSQLTPDEVVDDLFAKCVVQPLDIKEQREVQLERNIRKYLDSLNLSVPFEKAELGLEDYQFTWPLVQKKHHQTRVIKPLFLGQADPSKVIEHGDRLIGRLNRLKSFGVLPQEILVTWDIGENISDKIRRNQQLVIEDLKQFKAVKLAAASDTHRISAFAEAI